MGRTLLLLMALTWLGPVAADLPPIPDRDPGRPAVARQVSEPAAVLLLSVGEVVVWDRDGDRIALAPETPLQAGDVLHLPAGASAHVALGSGDRLDVAGEAWLALAQTAGETRVALWRGRVLIQALPGLSGRRVPLVVETPRGELRLRVGQVGLEVDGAGEEIRVFDGRAEWHGQPLVAGERLIVTSRERRERFAPEAEAVRWRARVGPLVPALRQAVSLYERGATDAARQRFASIQKAFPESAVAAYYLGQLALERGELATGVRQWRLYQRLDPEGARQRQVNRYLVALLSKHLEQEVRALLQREAGLARAPEPNTVAVAPFVARADSVDVRARRIGRALAALTVADLNKVPGLKVLERTSLEKLLQELRLSASALTDPARSAELGRLLRAQHILVGEYAIETEEAP